MARNHEADPCGQASLCASQAHGTVAVPPANTFQATSVCRSLLLGTVAAGMLLIGYGRRAYAGPGPCSGGTTVTCTGDQSNGITNVGGTPDFTSPPTTTLNVNSLTKNITPAAGVNGIYFLSDGNITINSDTTDGPGGPFVISTNGAFADGISAYSNFGAINVTHEGDLHATGAYANGIYTNSYGNTRIEHTGNITTTGAYRSEGIYAYSAAGSVSITQNGTITTRGVNSTGIFEIGPNGASVSQSGSIATSGYGSPGIIARSYFGVVKVTQTGDISTRGDYSPGVVGQNIYGSIAVHRDGNITTRGFGSYGIYGFSYFGAIDVRQTGNITTRGAYADGIYTFTSAKTTITVSGDIDTRGDGADGIDVNHPIGYGTSLVTINKGSTITGGTGSGDGIDFDGGRSNRVINFGTVTTRGENAIESDDNANDVVDNFGTVTGNIDLGAGTDQFNNRPGGLFNSGNRVFLGAGETLLNMGTLSPGGGGAVQTTALTGNLEQTSKGQLATDLNLGAATNDRVNVTGTAKLDGTVKVAVQNPALLTQQFTILSAAGGTTDNGLGLLASPALQAELLFPNPNDVVLGIDVNFAPDGLNRNQTHIGENLNAVLGALGPGGGTLGPALTGLLNVYSLNAYRDALDQLSPEIYADTEIAALYSSFDFSDNLLSCHVNGATTAAINYEGQCLWVGGKGRFTDGANTFQDIGFDETAGQFAAGAQFALNDVWRLGAGIGYQTSTLSTDTNATSTGDQVQGGVALKYNPGALLLAGVFSGGHGWYDTTRPMSFGGFAATAQGDQEIDVLQGRLRASYVLGNPGLYYKPMIDAAVTGVDLGSVTETGAGGASLRVHSGDHTVFSVSPAMELGTEWWWSNGTLVRPYVRGGLTWYSEDDVTVTASFLGAPGSVAPFTIAANTDDVQADVNAGVEMISGGDSTLRLFYDGHFGDRIAVNAAGFKASVKF